PAKSRLVVPPAQDPKSVSDLDPAIPNELSPTGEETSSDDAVLGVVPDQTEKVARARQQRQRLAKIVGGSLAATILGFLVVYWSTDSPPGSQTDPEQILERITSHIRSHRFEEALRELEEAPLDDNTTDKLRAEAVDAWLKD